MNDTPLGPPSLGETVYDKPGHLIRRCQQIAIALFLEHCAPYDLRPMQYAMLQAVQAEPGLDQITLAGLVAVDRSNAARLCLTLERRGLIERLPDPKDRRARRLVLTAKGAGLLREAEPAVGRVQAELLAPLPAAERAGFMRALRLIAEAHNEASRAPLRTMTAA